MARAFAKWSGLFFLVIGLLGFFVDHLFGFMHFDPLLNVIHLILGILGIAASFEQGRAVMYAKIGGAVYLVIGILGFFVQEWFGMMNLKVTENLLHLVIGAAGLYIGYVMMEEKGSVANKSA